MSLGYSKAFFLANLLDHITAEFSSPSTGSGSDCSEDCGYLETGQPAHPAGQLCHPLAEAGDDIRTVQELLGHKDVSTIMIYTHVIQKGVLGVKSPFDTL